MPTAKKLRQSDIARLANVSQATVSMVLNDRASEHGIPEATQERIRAAIAELGYQPNIAARSLRGGRNNLIGVHTFARAFPVARNDYFNEFLNGIEAQAVDEGLDLVLFASTQKPDGTRSIYGNGSNRLRLADGAVMLGFEQNDDELARLAGEGFDFVFIGRRDVPGVSIPFVTANYFDSMEPVVELFRTHGHQRVRYLGATVRRGPQDERLSGVLAFASAAGIEVDTEVVDPAEIGEVFLDGLMNDGTTAVIVETYELARALHLAVTAAGLDVPGDLSVVCLDTDALDEHYGSWSRVGVPRHEMGRAAVRLLLRRIDGEVPPDHVEVVPCTAPTAASVAAPRSVD